MAASILMHQKPVISIRKIQTISADILKYTEIARIKTYISNASTSRDIENTVNFLGFNVTGKLKDVKINL